MQMLQSSDPWLRISGVLYVIGAASFYCFLVFAVVNSVLMNTTRKSLDDPSWKGGPGSRTYELRRKAAAVNERRAELRSASHRIWRLSDGGSEPPEPGRSGSSV